MKLRILTTNLALSLLVACGGGDEFQPSENTAGSAGFAGAGTSGTGNTAGSTQAGSGGAAQAGSGQAGDAGAPQAGTGGAAGASAGQAGAAGTTQGGSSAQGGGSGAAGTPQGGSSGAGGTAPGECTPGEYSCLGDLLRYCNDQGLYEPKEACSNELCSAELQGCLTCKPGSIKGCLEGNMQEVCKVDGLGYEKVACDAAAPFCLEGACVQCVESSDCPASSKTCVGPLCLKNKCTEEPLPKDTPLPDAQQIAGDCKLAICDGSAFATSTALDSDLPVDDQNDCTAEVCSGGVAEHPALAVGTACGPAKDGFCNGKGICGVCIPGETRCTDKNQVETCSAEGQWVASDCALPAPVCSEGACVGVTQVTAGGNHSCALLSDGRVKCWGSNDYEQLGTGGGGPGVFSLRPKTVNNLENVAAIEAGARHTCAILKDGKVKCWGDNTLGQLGTGKNSAIVAKTAVDVPALSNVKQLALGLDFSCAIAGTDVLCWGNNSQKQVGVLTSGIVYEPTLIENGIKAEQLTAGNAHACALTPAPDLKTYCWGAGNYKQHGKDTQESLLPTLLNGVPAFKSIAAGANHTCAVATIGGVVCWGSNLYGELGLGYAWGSNNHPKFELPALSNFNKSLTDKNPKLSLGDGYSCQVIDLAVECAGLSTNGQIATGIENQMGDLTFFTSIQKVVSQIGDDPLWTLPNPVLSGAIQASSGTEHSCSLLQSGDVSCWGKNTLGQTSRLSTAAHFQFARSVEW